MDQSAGVNKLSPIHPILLFPTHRTHSLTSIPHFKMSQTPGSNQTPNDTNPVTTVTSDGTANTNTAETNTANTNTANKTVSKRTPADSTSSNSSIPCPPAGGSYETGAAAEVFLKNFANSNHYALSSIDSKPRFKKWKCIKGPNQKQLLKLVQDPQASIPTCPFTVSAKFESSSRTWTISVINPYHDHGPIPNLKPPKLPSLVPTQPKKRKQRSDAIVLDLTYDSDTADESDQEPIDDYKMLINKLKSFDDKTRHSLIGRFLRDCEITQDALESSKEHKALPKIVRSLLSLFLSSYTCYQSLEQNCLLIVDCNLLHLRKERWKAKLPLNRQHPKKLKIMGRFVYHFYSINISI
jgi:hypothetical protein